MPYHYNSVIGGFTNITKALHFTASFDLICEKFGMSNACHLTEFLITLVIFFFHLHILDHSENVAHFALVFSKIATKIKETASRKRYHHIEFGFKIVC